MSFTTLIHTRGPLPADHARLSEALTERSALMDRFDVGFGLSGLSLYFLYRFRALGREADRELARDLCLQAVHGLCDGAPRPSHTIECCELGGYLSRNAAVLGLGTTADQLLPVLDGVLEARMRTQLTSGSIDPYTGGFHPAWYFLTARGETERFAREWLSALPGADRLREYRADGRPAIPSGISHGLAGYATLLSTWLHSLNLHPRPAAPLTTLRQRALTYLEVLEDRCDDDYTYGCFYRDGRATTTSRLSLAYGDLGILGAGWQLACTLGATTTAERFLRRLRRTAGRRTEAETGMTGGNLLYGYAGAHLFFSHLNRRVPCPEFDRAARHWRKRAGTQVQEFHRGQLPHSGPYDYAAMQRLSLFEGPMGPAVVTWGLATDLTDLAHLFYLP